MNSELVNQVVSNTREIKAMKNQRRSTIVRKYGEEHDAKFFGNTATFYLPVDTDMEYISELKVKFVLGNIGITGSVSGGNYVGASKGTNKYPTYDSWLSAYPLGSAVDVDGSHGAQCWDYAAAFWYSQVNRNLQTGPNHSAYECWTVSRNVNAGSEFELITNWADIKKGDWVIWGGGSFGHIAMAVQSPTANTLVVYGQNQGGTPMPRGGAALNSAQRTSVGFLGAFRYKSWNT